MSTAHTPGGRGGNQTYGSSYVQTIVDVLPFASTDRVENLPLSSWMCVLVEVEVQGVKAVSQVEYSYLVSVIVDVTTHTSSGNMLSSE